MLERQYKILQICDRTHDFVQGFDLSEEIVRALSMCGHDVTFGVLTGKVDASLQQRVGCHVKQFRFSKKSLKPTSWSAMRQLISYIRENQFDIVIVHRFKPWLMLAIAALFVSRCRFAAMVHAFKQFDRKRRQWLVKILVNRRWRFVAVSSALRADLIQHAVPVEQIRVIPNTIDIAGVRASLLTREQARVELGLPLNATVIGTIGRCKPIKGQRYLVDAFAQVAAQYPETLLLIIGGGEEEEFLRRQTAEYGLQQRVVITGAVFNASRLLQAFDVFVLPSLSEGLPLAMLEAMAARLPVIGTRVGGVPEATGADGLLVEAKNSTQLAEAIEAVLQWSEEQRNLYVAKLSQRLHDEFSIEQYHRHWCALADELMTIDAR